MTDPKHHMYVCGFIPSQARKIAQFIFDEYFIKLEPNTEKRVFTTYVDKRINDPQLIKDAEDHFGFFDIKLVTIDDENEEYQNEKEEDESI